MRPIVDAEADSQGVPAAKRRKSRWGTIAGVPTEDDAAKQKPLKQPLQREATERASGFEDPKPSTAPSTNVKLILDRIGDVSSILSRARALKGASLVPKHATLKINRSLSDTKAAKVDVKISTVEGKSRSIKGKNRPSALKFVNKGYFMAKQRALEKKLEEKGVDTRSINNVLEIIDAGRSQSTRACALNVAQEFVARDKKRKHARLIPLNLKAVSTSLAAIKSQPTVDEPGLNWWDRDTLRELSPSEVIARREELAASAQAAPNDFERNLILSQINLVYCLKDGVCTHLVQHPEPVLPYIDASEVTPAVYLTAAEKKRMRRQRNKEREQDKRDKIQMGLIEAPPPKVKLSNLMRVLGEQAAANPTAVEQAVRKQVADRLKAHEQRTADQRLSEDARRAKKIKQWVAPAETDEVVQVAIFLIKDITSKQCLFKIHQNAKQLHLTGAAALCPGERNIVVVEGSTRAIKKYKAVMLRRIQWPGTSGGGASVAVTATSSGADILDPFCQVIWEGPAKVRCFKHWSTYPCGSLGDMEGLFSRNNAENYWKTIDRFRPPQADLV